MISRELEQISSDIHGYTLKFQGVLLKFFRDSLIRRLYKSEDELDQVLNAYNQEHRNFGILNENISDNPLDKNPYGRMDFAGAIKILRFISSQGNENISQDFLKCFDIEDSKAFSKKMMLGNKSRNIFAHYNENKKITFTKDDMKESMLFFMDMIADIRGINPEKAEKAEKEVHFQKENSIFLEEKKRALEELQDIYSQAMLHTNLLEFTLNQLVEITGADEKSVRMKLEYYDITRDNQNLYSEDREALQAVIESLRCRKEYPQTSDFFPVSRDDKKNLNEEEMRFIAEKCVLIIDFSALMQTTTYYYLQRYCAMHFEMYNTALFIDVNSMEKLRRLAYDSSFEVKEKYRQHAKEIFKLLIGLKDYRRIQYVADKDSVENDIVSVIKHFDSDTRICILTADKESIDSLWKLQQGNIAVLSANVNGNLTINQGKDNQLLAAALLQQMKDTQVNLEKYQLQKAEIELSQTASESGSYTKEIIDIRGGIPQRGLFAPNLKLSFDYYERGSEKGAEGTVYLTNRGDYVVKIYHRHMNTMEKKNRIEAMLKKDVNSEYICWPCDILLSSEFDGQFIGYVMRVVKSPESLGDRIEELDLLSAQDDRYDRMLLMEFCKKIAEQFYQLHKNEIFMADLNESNILVSRDNDEIYLVDTDSYQFDDYSCTVGQELYTSPEYIIENGADGNLSYNRPKSIKDEQFAMAVLFYRILFLGSWPYKMVNGHVYEAVLNRRFEFGLANAELTDLPEQLVREGLIWNNTPAVLREMFVRCFRSSKRYKAEDWVDAFNAAENEISSGNYSRELVPGYNDYLEARKREEDRQNIIERNWAEEVDIPAEDVSQPEELYQPEELFQSEEVSLTEPVMTEDGNNYPASFTRRRHNSRAVTGSTSDNNSGKRRNPYAANSDNTKKGRINPYS